MAATKWNLKIYFSILLSVSVFIFPTSSHGEFSKYGKQLSNPNAPIILIVGDNLRQNHRSPRHSTRLNRHSVYDRNDNLDQDFNARNSQLSPEISNLLASLFSYKTLSSAKYYKRPKVVVSNDKYNRYRTSNRYRSNKNRGQSSSNYYKNDRDNVKIYNDNDQYKTIILDRNDKFNFNDHSYRNDRYLSKSKSYGSQNRDKRYNEKRNRLDGAEDEPLVKTLLHMSNVLRKKDSCEDTDSCEDQTTTTEDPCDQNGNSCDDDDNNISTRGIPSDFVSEVPPNCC